ncbi:MAG: aldo/keto reductase [Acidobacteria bacterium]|nr:aldo/keto reductase [Acidobacteriota bacterium]MDW7984218.1 aldo/keto reductase [Acidobacteriota bacterium]
MWTIELGRTGVQLPVLALGTWNFRDAARMGATIRAAVDLGVFHIDTAEMYPGAEEVIGTAVRDIRDRVFITSKVHPRHATYRGTLEACERSLRRLRTSYLDLYLLHWLERDTPLEETLRAFQTLLEQGKVRFVGVSNLDVSDLRRAQALFRPHALVNDQVEYNLTNRRIERDLIPYCREAGLTVSGYSPFWEGRIPRRRPEWRVLQDIATRYGRTPYQVILNFLARQRDVILIFKTESVEHLRENVAALDFVLAPEDVARIDQAFPP